jgi:uncharacterized protein YehS (DUF1456 family)
MNREDIISILKAQQWEKCKGELFALMALSGSKATQYDGNIPLKGEWKFIKELVDEFIKNIEDEGVHE